MAFDGTSYMCTQFKLDLLRGLHDFRLSGGNAFKLALFTNSQAGNDALGGSTTDMDETVTNYSASAINEVSHASYTDGGATLTRIDPTSSGTTAFADFANETWSTATFTARGALLYNDDITTPTADAAVAILDFGSDKTATAGDFTVTFPTADASNAIIRIA